MILGTLIAFGQTKNALGSLIEREESKQATSSAKQFLITVTAFIAVNHIGDLPFVTCGDGKPLYFAGDDRSFNPAFGASCDEAPGCRMRQIVSLAVEEDGSHDLRLNVSQKNQVGATRAYAPDALEDGRIDSTDDDERLGDCHLLHERGRASNDNMQVAYIVKGRKITMHLVAGAANPLIRSAPEINWDLEMTFDLSGPKPTCTLKGRHDGYPSYEIYVNNVFVHHHATSYSRADLIKMINLRDTVALVDGGVPNGINCLP